VARRSGVVVVALAAAAVLAGCGVHETTVAMPPPPAPAAQQAGAAQVPATPVRRPVVRRQPDPAVVLATQIRAALSRRTWPAGFGAWPAPSGAPEWVHDGCLDVSDANRDRCVYGPAHGTRTMALIGDSIAVGWLPGLRRAESMRSTRIHVLTHRQCPNLRGEVIPSCASHLEWVLRQVRELHPDVAVLSSRYEGRQTWNQWRLGLRRTLAAVRPYAKTLIVIAPPPDLPVARGCFSRGLAPRECRAPVTLTWRQYGEAEREAAVAAGARFVDPRPWVCIDEVCPALIGDTIVSFDGNHLSGTYGARLGPVLSRAIG